MANVQPIANSGSSRLSSASATTPMDIARASAKSLPESIKTTANAVSSALPVATTQSVQNAEKSGTTGAAAMPNAASNSFNLNYELGATPKKDGAQNAVLLS